MSDSRYYSLKLLRKLNPPINWKSKTTLFLLSLLVAALGVYFVRDPEFTKSQDYVLFILFFAVGLWVTEAIPPFAVGILIIGFLVFSLGFEEANQVKQYVQTWSDSVIWLFLGGFFLAEGMKKSKLDEQLLSLTAPRLGNQSKFILLGLMMLTGILSMLMSNTATTAMMIATISPILLRFGKKAPITKSLLIGIPTAAGIGGMGTIIGSAPNAIAVGALEGVGIEISFIEWMMFGVPVALLLILIFWKSLLVKYQLKDQKLSLDFLYQKQLNITEEEEEKVSKTTKNLTFIILVITLLFWLTSQWTGIPVAAVSGIPIVGLTMFRIIDAEDVRKLPWDTLMLVAGGLALGLAVQQNGLADFFIAMVNVEGIHTLLLFISFGLLTVILSNIMSNTATATIIIPISISLILATQQGNPIILPLIISLSASCALLLPVSTPPNAIAFSTGMLEQSDFRLGGILIGILGPLLIMGWVILLTFLFY
ncbi:MAG: SLC13 family permease [Bacteroidota bacterium]